MAYNVVASDSANSDLEEILTYIAETLMNPRAAANFADALDEKYETLETHPLIFELSRNDQLAKKGYRRFVGGNYVALYTVDEERNEVTIARIFYGGRNYQKYV